MSGAASIDIRLPIGGLFTALGVLIGGYGIATHGDAAHYAPSLGININIWWGLVMLVAGLLMLVMGMRASREHHPSGMRETFESPEGARTEENERGRGLER
jgi:hypothetical protein